ncbi:MAG: acyl-CoA dehydrogenase family protein [Rhodocyclaceae bacterium]|nr:acyl-CoA dehydrogenase family protein [Rhodocyclaceae bacterium]
MFSDPPYLNDEHRAFRDMARRFVADEITPNVNEWDEAGRFPRELYAKAAAVGIQGVGYPEAYGGTPADEYFRLIGAEELARSGSGGLCASLGSHNIAMPMVATFGSEALKQEVLVPVLRGEKIAALAVTEPGGGSDVAAVRTSARKEGEHYLVNGEKTFITSGMRADVITVAVRTDPESKGPNGISILVIDGNSPGLTRSELKKMGWWMSDTAHLHFDNVKVPTNRLVGVENAGFLAIMHNFNGERMAIAAMAYTFAELCYKEALSWARERKTFGKPLVKHQVIRHKLVDMAMRIDAARTLAWDLANALQTNRGTMAERVARISMLKVTATDTMKFCADQAVQILGGMGFMRGTLSERIYREVKVLSIGGGADEIMKELAGRQLGI